MSDLAKLGLAALAALLVGLGIWRYVEARERAEAADQRADSALAVLDATLAAKDSIDAVLDSVVRREQTIRDSLSDELIEAREQADDEDAATVRAGEHLKASLDSLARSVRPELKPVVQTARAQADSTLDAHGRFRAQMERQVALMQGTNASLRRELDQTTTALDTTRAALRDARSALGEMTEARNRWREAARLRLFGLPPAVTHGAAALAGLGLGLAVP